MIAACNALFSIKKRRINCLFLPNHKKNIATFWKLLIWLLLFFHLINTMQVQAQTTTDTVLHCSNSLLTGEQSFIVGMDSDHRVTSCLLQKKPVLKQQPLFSNLKYYLYFFWLSISGSHHSDIPYADVSQIKHQPLPLFRVPGPILTTPALIPPDRREPLNQREWIRSYLIPDNHLTDDNEKLNAAFHRINQYQKSGHDKPEKHSSLDIYASVINHKVRQVIALPENFLLQERSFTLLNNLFDASLNAWLKYYLSVSDSLSLIELVPEFIEAVQTVMATGAGGDDWDKGSWITNEFINDAPFAIHIHPYSLTAAQWMQKLITLDMALKRKLIALMYSQLQTSALSGNRDMARILRDRIMLIELETGEWLNQISDPDISALELSMHAEQLINEFLLRAEDVRRYHSRTAQDRAAQDRAAQDRAAQDRAAQDRAAQDRAKSRPGGQNSAVELLFNEVEKRLRQLSTSLTTNQGMISQLNSALESLALLSERLRHDNDNFNNHNQVVDAGWQPRENSDNGASSTTVSSGRAAAYTGSRSSAYRPSGRLHRGNGGDGGSGGGDRHPHRSPPHITPNNSLDILAEVITNLESNPEQLTLSYVKELYNIYYLDLFKAQSLNQPNNTLLHVIVSNHKSEIIKWINLNIPDYTRKLMYQAKNSINITPAMLSTKAKREREGISFTQISTLSNALAKTRDPLARERELNSRKKYDRPGSKHKETALRNEVEHLLGVSPDEAKKLNVRRFYNTATEKDKTCIVHRERGCEYGFARLPCCSDNGKSALICLSSLCSIVQNHLISGSSSCPNCQASLDVRGFLESTLAKVSEDKNQYQALLCAPQQKQKALLNNVLKDCEKLDKVLRALINNIKVQSSLIFGLERYIDKNNSDECSICFESAHCIVIPECQHRACTFCMEHYLDELAGDFSLTSRGILCPGQPCQVSIPDDIQKFFWGISGYKRMRHQQLKQAYQGSDMTLYCPWRYCDATFDPKELSSSAVKCQQCYGRFCVECGARPYHDNLTCEQNKQAETTEEGADISMAIFLEKNKDTHKLCPGCGSVICKNKGCKVMKCTSCNTEFCWHCLTVGENIHSHQCNSALDSQAINNAPDQKNPSKATCDFCHKTMSSRITTMFCGHAPCSDCYAKLVEGVLHNDSENICTECRKEDSPIGFFSDEEGLLGEATGTTSAIEKQCLICDNPIQDPEYDLCETCQLSLTKECLICGNTVQDTKYDVCETCLPLSF
ncbi:IBR domain-containing protein [Endozoicomonas euniceicola]|uniref:RBR-type E3 ubiquitin transferase n=1 Tax=Endozoicomonas euniceicola TaxID=1234143 RepID=A0ABY6GZ26_9GAMM|nr:IBR domain-containing protein [Endozoicomonas euniceicola]UYM18067.1 hypothetical protein NX720_09225 [Endozoicomonas euniceicola]